jgi:RND superfamily putative drug exporter
MASQLACRLADPEPTARGDYASGEDAAEANTDWDEVQGRCLAVAVAMLEEAR